ncbi:LOW QUALITY PROTEIN: thiosulfate sulfurtransferase/rhodanese-like domain-containing protein 2 [Danio aesculapii]|uniref:LOW QUALITY PROTEIN: thiosulfate sulfurtransferase/rhodanese-like domain-containing protein 2 n=1 Tax=Danio aesculapii TaxID=1142201 RepID=UPI0024BFAA7C|nr:LOW QUALITY PROTEIN: thiosulfate sulfurtransferase/rhodanese-like domain-containing protein 2 [Danio aesculapii]
MLEFWSVYLNIPAVMMADELLYLCDVESLSAEIQRREEQQEFTESRRIYSRARRRVFAQFVASKQAPASSGSGCVWLCCGHTHTDPASIHRHASSSHSAEIHQLTSDSLKLQKTHSDSLNHQTDSDSLNHQTDSDSLNPQTHGDSLNHQTRSNSLNHQTDSDDSLNHQTHSDSVTHQNTHGDSVNPASVCAAAGVCVAGSADVSSWMPDMSRVSEHELTSGEGVVLLFYCYCLLPDPQLISRWQQQLCTALHLTGKVRVATEGINGTVGGTAAGAELYMQTLLRHPAFSSMQTEDFKRSAGGAQCFSSLKVGVHREIVPMGVDPELVSYRSAGIHLEPQEFHREVQALVESPALQANTILLDCRNFYESKIGQFSCCVAPDIRKFSYFPDYVDQNLDLFRDKRVLMYCTGGIRCERGSAYLRSKRVCKEVYQLKGGIHKYLEQFPDGFYRGKLFVFDERYAIAFNQDVISVCRYCSQPWDQYVRCSTGVCGQLLLSCVSCRVWSDRLL